MVGITYIVSSFPNTQRRFTPVGATSIYSVKNILFRERVLRRRNVFACSTLEPTMVKTNSNLEKAVIR